MSLTRNGRSTLFDARDSALADSDPAPAQLSPRERAIVIGLCDGLSRDDVARRIGRSRSTLDKTISMIYASTGFSSAYQLVAWGYRSGLYPCAGARREDSGRGAQR